MVNEEQLAVPEDVTAWTLAPAAPPLGSQLWRLGKVFATGALGGALSLGSLGLLVAPSGTQTRGATPGLRIDRERQALCLRLGVTPRELAALEAAGGLQDALAEAAE